MELEPFNDLRAIRLGDQFKHFSEIFFGAFDSFSPSVLVGCTIYLGGVFFGPSSNFHVQDVLKKNQYWLSYGACKANIGPFSLFLLN